MTRPRWRRRTRPTPARTVQPSHVRILTDRCVICHSPVTDGDAACPDCRHTIGDTPQDAA